MLMFTTRLVVVARKLKRRVHAFIGIDRHVSSGFHRICILELDERSEGFRRFRKLGHIRVVRLSSIRFLVSTTFLSVSVSFFLSSLFYLLHEPIEFFSLLEEERKFLPFVHSVGHAALRAHQIITRNVLSHCHGIIIATYVAFLSRKDFAI